MMMRVAIGQSKDCTRTSILEMETHSWGFENTLRCCYYYYESSSWLMMATCTCPECMAKMEPYSCRRLSFCSEQDLRHRTSTEPACGCRYSCYSVRPVREVFASALLLNADDEEQCFDYSSVDFSTIAHPVLVVVVSWCLLV